MGTVDRLLSNPRFAHPSMGDMVRFEPLKQCNVVGFGAAGVPYPGVMLTMKRKILGKESAIRDRGKREGEGGNAAHRGSRIMFEFEAHLKGLLAREELSPTAFRIVKALELYGVTLRRAEAGIWSKALHFATRIDLVGEDKDGKMCIIEVKSVIHDDVREKCGSFKRLCTPLRGRVCTPLLKYHIQNYLSVDTLVREYGIPASEIRSLVVCEDLGVYVSETPPWLVDLWPSLHDYMASTVKKHARPKKRKLKRYECPHCIRVFCNAKSIPKHIRACHRAATVPELDEVMPSRRDYKTRRGS